MFSRFIFTIYDKGLQGVTGGHTGLQGVKGVTGGHTGLQGVKGVTGGLQRVKRG